MCYGSPRGPDMFWVTPYQMTSNDDEAFTLEIMAKSEQLTLCNEGENWGTHPRKWEAFPVPFSWLSSNDSLCRAFVACFVAANFDRSGFPSHFLEQVVHSLICLHRSLIRSLHTARFARILNCTHSFVHSHTDFCGRWKVNDWMFYQQVFLNHSWLTCHGPSKKSNKYKMMKPVKQQIRNCPIRPTSPGLCSHNLSGFIRAKGVTRSLWTSRQATWNFMLGAVAVAAAAASASEKKAFFAFPSNLSIITCQW